ncbi:unnamed protein product [Microthlaspi erraticum]|uniref:Man1/Src1-like C-terminal domain-containing protein n=1 Tax=Microthlaspi erraticum TaxID=1685480 RepID=A0A6D2JA36_9BRAS|nr:unnamed protein product [Microthlaspi erraticum]
MVLDPVISHDDTIWNSNGMNELKCLELLVQSYKPLTCRMHQWFLKHIIMISSSCAMLLVCAILHRIIQRKRCFSRRIEELYDQVCDFLEENAVASNSADEPPWVIASRLRDHLLLPRERRDPLLWTKVEELIQEDSRMDRYPKLVKGEQKVVGNGKFRTSCLFTPEKLSSRLREEE